LFHIIIFKWNQQRWHKKSS